MIVIFAFRLTSGYMTSLQFAQILAFLGFPIFSARYTATLHSTQITLGQIPHMHPPLFELEGKFKEIEQGVYDDNKKDIY